jgi:hypothetical protein
MTCLDSPRALLGALSERETPADRSFATPALENDYILRQHQLKSQNTNCRPGGHTRLFIITTCITRENQLQLYTSGRSISRLYNLTWAEWNAILRALYSGM